MIVNFKFYFCENNLLLIKYTLCLYLANTNLLKGSLRMLKDNNNKIIFKTGNFEAELTNPAHIKTTVTIKDNKITDVKIRSLKDEKPIEKALQEEFKGQIINAQSVKIDSVSGATILTKAVKSVVGEVLDEARFD